MLHKHLLLLSLGCLLLGRAIPAGAQVDKAMKYAWFYDYNQAEKFLQDPQKNLDKSMVIELADALYFQGKYPQALYYYKKADAAGGITDKKSIRNYVHASSLMNEKSPYFSKSGYFKTNYLIFPVIDTFSGNSLNEDFTTLYWNGMLFVTSSRKSNGNPQASTFSPTRMPYLDIHPYSEAGKKLPFPTNLPRTINTPMHDGPMAISGDTTMLVLTRNYSKASTAGIKNLFLTCYFRDASRRWGTAKPLGFCQTEFSCQHPFFNNKEKALYFSSDMPGGFGGFDLYKTRWNGTEWTPPVNLGPEVNSEYDEVFPGFTPAGDLTYSSNHIETTGGLDIVVYSNGNRYLLSEPMNTLYDDFGLTFKSTTEGYISSNRFSGKFDDNIYHFVLSEPKKQNLYVKVYDAKTRIELDMVTVKVSDPSTKASNEMTTRWGMDNVGLANVDARKALHFEVYKHSYLPYRSDDNEFMIKDGKLIKEVYLSVNPVYAGDDNYITEDHMIGYKSGCILDNDSINGKVPKPADVILSLVTNPLGPMLFLDPIEGRMKITAGARPGNYRVEYALCSKASPNMCDTGVITLVVKGELTASDKEVVAEPESNGPPEIRVLNDTGYATVNGGYLLNVRNNDRLNNKKTNFLNSVIENEQSDNPGIKLNKRTGEVMVQKGMKPGTYNLSYEMHQRGNKNMRSKANVTVVVRDFDQIPGRGTKANNKVQANNTVVYFHNDEPRTLQVRRPGYNYKNSYESYLDRYEEFYKRSADSKESLDAFFSGHVEKGYSDLNQALSMIESKLNQGVQVEISVTAYCSPIASTAYNNKLSSRRLISVMRFVKKWNDGALADAIESNRITFWEHAVGELQAPPDVSSDYNKLDESVFGIKASRERRVSVTVKVIGGK